jgi:subfamily B ATP-binding cassette protein MsbA
MAMGSCVRPTPVTSTRNCASEPLMAALLKPLLDRGFTRGEMPLWFVPAAVLLLFAVRGIAQFISQYALSRIANEGMQKLRRVLFERLLGAELALFTRQSASALSNTVVYEVQTGAMLLVQALLGLSRDGFTLIALLGYLVYLNWKLTLIVAFLVPSISWIMKVFSKRLYRSRSRASRPPTNWPTWSRKTCSPTAWCACTAPSRRRSSASNS